MNNQHTLKNIADISIGYSFRVALDWKDTGNIFVLQASNISNNAEITESELNKIDFDDNRAKSFIEIDDVVLSSRGWFRAGVIKSKAKNILASSSVFILRLKTDQVLGEYLAIYLNSSAGQRQLKSKATGGAINTILRSDLGDIEIPVPSLNNQKQIVNLHRNNQQLKKSLAEKIELTGKIIDGVINNLINTK